MTRSGILVKKLGSGNVGLQDPPSPPPPPPRSPLPYRSWLLSHFFFSDIYKNEKQKQSSLGSLSDGNEKGKKAMGFDWQNNNFIITRCYTTITWKCLISPFVEDGDTRQQQLSFRIQLQKQFATIYRIKRDGIEWAFEAERIHFLSGVLMLPTTMGCFYMTSRRPYWSPKTMKRRPCWCPKPVPWELNSFLMQTLSFVLINLNLHRCWPREWKHSVLRLRRVSLFLYTAYYCCQNPSTSPKVVKWCYKHEPIIKKAPCPCSFLKSQYLFLFPYY